MNLIVINGDLPDDSDKVVLPPDILERAIDTYGESLPHPLIFKLSSPDAFTFVGVKQFSSDPGTVILPKFISDKLNVVENNEIGIELAQDIPKGTFLKLKPLQFYQEINNWKYYLESNLTNHYTILNKHETLVINDYQFLIEDCNANTISIIDTDIILDIVPLNDIMANQQMNFNSNTSVAIGFGDLDIKKIKPFNVDPNIQTYKLDIMNIESDISISIATDEDICNIDLLVGFDKLVNLENFIDCTIDQDTEDTKMITVPYEVIEEIKTQCKYDLDQGFDDEEISKWLYIVPFTWEYTSDINLSIRKHTKEQEPEDHHEVPGIVCSNCERFIEKSKLTLHQAFCFKNNIKCECGQIFLKKVPNTHWHCPSCLRHSTTESTIFKFKHEKLYHQTFTCNCNDKIVYSDYIDFIKSHKSTECPNKLHECKFCHLILPQGEATYIDRFENLTNHENSCGNKTDECFKCQKLIKRKDLRKHLQLHKLDTQQSNERFKISYNKCSNENCVNLVKTHNQLNLCDICYGPLYSSVDDPTNMKLQIRLERRYMLQLNKGCEYNNCQNKYCKRNTELNGIKQIMNFINTELLTNVVGLPINKGLQPSSNKFWFCVNESMNKKLMLLNSFKEYPEEMIIKGLNEIREVDTGNLQEWLSFNV